MIEIRSAKSIRRLLFLGCFAVNSLAVGSSAPELKPSEDDVLIYVGYSQGHGGGFGLEVRLSGKVRAWGFENDPDMFSLSRGEIEDLRTFVESSRFQRGIDLLSRRNYRTGRGDLPEVGIGFGAVEYGFPVCTQHPAFLEPEVREIVDWANDFGRKHFAAVWSKDLPISTCLPGEYF